MVKKTKKSVSEDEKIFSCLAESSEIFVSQYDIEHEMCQNLIAEAIKIGKIKDENDIEGILQEIWGFNLDLGYEVEVKEHRTRFNTIYTGNRYCGFERYDKEWYTDGMISQKMKGLRESIIARQHYERW